MVILTAMLALVLAAALVYAAAAEEWMQLNGQSQGILFILVVGACTDYALLLVSRYRETLQENARPSGGDAHGGARHRRTDPRLRRHGHPRGAVPARQRLRLQPWTRPGRCDRHRHRAVAALTFLPAVLLLLGRVAFWPFRPVFEGEASEDTEPTETVLRRHRLWGAIATSVSRHPRRYWVATAVALLAAAAFVPQFRAEGTSDFDIFRTEVDSVVGQEVLEDGFGHAVTAQPAVIIADADHMDEVIKAAEGVDGVTEVTPLTEAPEMPGGPPAGEDGAPGGPPAGEDGAQGGPPPGVAGGSEGGADGPPPGVAGGQDTAAEPKVVDGRVLLEASLSEPAESTEAVEITRELRDAVHAVDGANALVGGPSAESLDTLDTATRDLYVVVPLVLAVVLLVLIVLLRSLVAPVLLIITTVVSFGSALGVGALVFNHLLDLPGADPGVPLFAFVFLVALGIDYNIFLVTRVREEAVNFGHREGVLRGLTVTGGVITSAGVVLAATFAALTVVPLLFLLQLAFLVAFGVLLDALIVRSLLVPALSIDVGRAMWWPSRLARGAH